MIRYAIVALVISISGVVHAKKSCAGDKFGSGEAFGGFCVTASTPVTPAQLQFLSQKFLTIKAKFPHLFALAMANGYQTITLAPAETGETGGLVLGEIVSQTKSLFFYADIFTVDQNLPSPLPYSLAEIAIVHELLHAFDDHAELVRSHLTQLGWSQLKLAGGYAFGDLTNFRISERSIEKIKSELGPLLPTLGPLKVYIESRRQMMAFGFPTIYSVMGGPIETFADVGAYIACDPYAETYVPEETLTWYRRNILR